MVGVRNNNTDSFQRLTTPQSSQYIPADTDDKTSRWARAILPWSTFTKVEWQTSGAHTFIPVDMD